MAIIDRQFLGTPWVMFRAKWPASCKRAIDVGGIGSVG